MNKLADWILGIVFIAATAYGVAWYTRATEIPANVTVEATPAPEIKREEKITIKPVSVKAYKPAVKGKLKLPELVVNDPYAHVLASSQTPNDERPHTITTVVNEQTGEISSFDRADPLPWMAVNTKTEIGAYYGLKQGEQALRIEGRQELLQIKAVHIGAIASADMMRTGTDGFIGVGMWARW